MKKTKQHKNPSLGMVRRFFPKVTTVRDATTRAIVEVTPEDNAHAQVKSHRTCALAIACKRSFDADGVIIGLTTSWVINGTVATRYQNAGTVSREITSFDRKAGFDAGLYILSPAGESNRLGRKHIAPAWKGDRSKSKPRQFRHYTRNVRASLHGYHPIGVVA